MAQYVFVAAMAMQSMQQIQQGRFQASQYQAQGAQAKLQGRAQAVRYEQQGNAIMRRSLEAQAMARARAAAGGIDPFSGSAKFVQDLSARDAAEDLGILTDNAQLARLNGEAQASAYNSAARQARTNGLLAGFTTAATGYGQYSQLYGGFGGGMTQAPAPVRDATPSWRRG